jgi:uncharacterized coiled-coil DUF342 family protein
MKKLTKEQSKRREAIVASGNAIKSEVADAWSALAERIADFNEVLGRFNAAVDEAIEFRDEIVGAIEEYVDERSERWQESDAASSYEDWKQQWEGVEIESVEEIAADEPELPDFDALLEPATEVET